MSKEKPTKLTKRAMQKVWAARILYREGLYMSLMKDLVARKPGAVERAELLIDTHNNDLKRVTRWIKKHTKE